MGEAAASRAPREGTPLFSVVIPTLGGEAKLLPLLDGLSRQTLERALWELVLVFDGAPVPAAVRERLEPLDARVLALEHRQGPARARNAGAALARGTYLAWAEDDVVPDPEWLAIAAGRLAADPDLDVLEGLTRKPGGRSVRIRGEDTPQYILCNLFVRKTLFELIGGVHEGYYDAGNGVYFREDTDLGYSLEAAGAKVGREPAAIVTHPIEHPRYLDPLRWAKRYEMDALLARRHPLRFHERIEIHRLGPFRIRRPIVRACVLYTLGVTGALVGWLAGSPVFASVALAVSAASFLPIWAKWRFELRRLPVFLLVPFALLAALIRGSVRVRSLSTRSRP